MLTIFASLLGLEWIKSGLAYRPSQVWGWLLGSFGLGEHYQVQMLPVARIMFVSVLFWAGVYLMYWEYTHVWTSN